MKSSTLFLLVILSMSSSCHEDYRFVDNSDCGNVIYRAESYIVDNKITLALDVYMQAEESGHYLFGIDYYNALVCAVKLKRWNVAMVMLRGLAKKGVKTTFFNQELFREFCETRQWHEFESTFNEITTGIDSAYLDSLKILIEADQRAYCILPTNELKSEQVFSSTYSLDSTFEKLIRTRGFPTEELVGLHIINDTFLLPTPVYSVLFFHSIQSNSRLVESYLRQAYEHNNIQYEIYQHLVNPNHQYFWMTNSTIFREKQLSALDSCYYEHYKEKVIYNFYCKENDFKLFAPIWRISDKSQNSWTKEDSVFYNVFCEKLTYDSLADSFSSCN